MNFDELFFDYKKMPGIIKNHKNSLNNGNPLVSIITSYYNSNQYMWQTINCVLNQTFQSWEWIIVNDGSTNAEAVKYLEEVEKIDSRIKIYHKENEGLAKGRDYAIKYATTKYILPLDADDLIEPTYIETMYWTLETNTDAAWAFTNSVGFGKYTYLSNQKFDSDKMKTDNQITATSLIRKEKILELGGYGKAARYVNEDWHLWLRMLANNLFPVQVGYYGFWYRRQENSLLTEINDTKKQENDFRLRDLKIEADKITQKIEPILYPKKEKDKLKKNNINISEEIEILEKDEKSYIYILPFLGIDKKMYKKIKKDSKVAKIYILTLQNTEYSSYVYRQKYEQFATIYDLTTFLDAEYWINFIQYVKNTRNVEKIYLSNTKYNNEIKQNFEVVEICDCNNSKITYNNKILQHKFLNWIPVRAFRKIVRILINIGKEK